MNNFEQAVWHLEKAEQSPDVPGSTMHANLAQARATLALVEAQTAAPAAKNEIDADELARLIWETSRADEGTISVTGALIVAHAIINHL